MGREEGIKSHRMLHNPFRDLRQEPVGWEVQQERGRGHRMLLRLEAVPRREGNHHELSFVLIFEDIS